MKIIANLLPHGDAKMKSQKINYKFTQLKNNFAN